MRFDRFEKFDSQGVYTTLQMVAVLARMKLQLLGKLWNVTTPWLENFSRELIKMKSRTLESNV